LKRGYEKKGKRGRLDSHRGIGICELKKKGVERGINKTGGKNRTEVRRARTRREEKNREERRKHRKGRAITIVGSGQSPPQNKNTKREAGGGTQPQKKN